MAGRLSKFPGRSRLEEFGGSCQGSGMRALQFHCPHCGALYEKSDTKAGGRDDEVVHCVVCRHAMYKAAEGQSATFKLIKRPESDTE